MTIRFIHAADLHIDSPMKGLAARSEKEGLATAARAATRDAFTNMIDAAFREQVDFIIIAGDVFDGEWDNTETGIWTATQFRRLRDAGIPVFAVYGNHDKKNAILKNVAFPENVHVFSESAPQTFVFPDDCPEIAWKEYDERVAITGRSYPEWRCTEDLAAGYPSAKEGMFNIGVLHTDLESGGEYAPTSLETLTSKGYDYWALGHQHRRETFSTGQVWIGYSGVLQARHINEAAPKGCCLVEISNGRLTDEPKFLCVDAFRWQKIELDASDVATEEELADLFAQKADDAASSADGRRVAARVFISGRTPLYGALHRRREENSLDELFVKALTTHGDFLWIEQYDLYGLAPPIPADFWDSEVMSEIRERLDPDLSEPDSATNYAVSEIRNKTKDVGKELREDASEGAGDLWSPEQLRIWRLRAMEVLADGFSAKEAD